MGIPRWFTCDNSCPGDHSEEFNIRGPHPSPSNKPPPAWPRLAVTKPYWQVIRDNLNLNVEQGGRGGCPAHKCPHLNSGKNIGHTMPHARRNNLVTVLSITLSPHFIFISFLNILSRGKITLALDLQSIRTSSGFKIY